MTEKQKVVVFASGSKGGGGSGFEKLFNFSTCSGSHFEIAAVVSNHEYGGVRARADRLGVPFMHFSAPWNADRYRAILASYGAKWVLLSGWLKFVVGLDPAHTINIHPALLSYRRGRFGGPDLYGHLVHEAVARSLRRSKKLRDDPHSGFTMHFVIDGKGDKKKAYDRGPVFAEVCVPLKPKATADEIGKAVNRAEHMWQPLLTDMVISGWIRLEKGKVIVPIGFEILSK